MVGAIFALEKNLDLRGAFVRPLNLPRDGGGKSQVSNTGSRSAGGVLDVDADSDKTNKMETDANG
jgi:hypothetical protein